MRPARRPPRYPVSSSLRHVCGDVPAKLRPWECDARTRLVRAVPRLLRRGAEGTYREDPSSRGDHFTPSFRRTGVEDDHVIDRACFVEAIDHEAGLVGPGVDRKSTRLNSRHVAIS